MTTRMTQVGTVFAPVADQEKALEFYVGQLGFEQRADFEYGHGGRWVEVAPAGSAMAIALVPPSEGEPPARGAALCALATEDIEADHARLHALGVAVDDVIGREGTTRSGLASADVSIPDPVPAQFCFCDPDGNRFLVVQP